MKGLVMETVAVIDQSSNDSTINQMIEQQMLNFSTLQDKQVTDGITPSVDANTTSNRNSGDSKFTVTDVIASESSPLWKYKVDNGIQTMTICINYDGMLKDKPLSNNQTTFNSSGSSLSSAFNNLTPLASTLTPPTSENGLLPNVQPSIPNTNAVKDSGGGDVVEKQREDAEVVVEPLQMRGVVCAKDAELCYIYCRESLEELAIMLELTDKKHIIKGNWLLLTVEETPDGFAILDFEKIDECFKTIALSDTIVVQCAVNVPLELSEDFHTKTALSSDISKNVFDRNKLLNAEKHKGRQVRSVLGYSYNAGDENGVWVVVNVFD